MDPVLALAALAVGVVLGVLATSPLAQRGSRGPAAAAPETCQRHIWHVATTEEVAGRTRMIWRCSECGAVEARERSAAHHLQELA